jgi:tetratricopeptide (TPR) repeat protein
MVFEHRMYLPSFALAGLVGYALLKFLERSRPSHYVIATASATAVAVLLALSTRTAVAGWKDDYSLWRHALVHAPLDPRVHDNLGDALWRLDRIDEAIEHATRSIQLDPTYVNGLHNLGRLVKIKGDRARAYELFNRALLLKPDYGPARFSLGMLYLEAGYFAEARREFELTLAYDPYYVEARRFLEYSIKAMQQGPAKGH